MRKKQKQQNLLFEQYIKTWHVVIFAAFWLFFTSYRNQNSKMCCNAECSVAKDAAPQHLAWPKLVWMINREICSTGFIMFRQPNSRFALHVQTGHSHITTRLEAYMYHIGKFMFSITHTNMTIHAIWLVPSFPPSLLSVHRPCSSRIHANSSCLQQGSGKNNGS